MFYAQVPFSFRDSILRVLFLVLLLVAPTTLFAGDGTVFAGVELTIPDETVPPGGMLQLKIPDNR